MTEENGGTQVYTPPATQEALDQIIKARIDRERAKFADYDELKTKLASYEQAQQVSKSELETLQTKLKDAEAKIEGFETKAQLDALRREVAKNTGVPVEAITGSTKEEMEAQAKVIAPLINQAPVIPGQEQSPTAISADPTGDFANKFFA